MNESSPEEPTAPVVPTFGGFDLDHTTPIPDNFIDELLSELSGAETKVMLYLFRRTMGFGKISDAVSLSQFEKGIITHDGKVLDKGCGLNRETICKALTSLEKRGCIEKTKRTGKHRDQYTTLYKLRCKEVVGFSDQGDRINELPQAENPTRGSRKTSEKVVGKSDIQETVPPRNSSQETDRQRRGAAARVYPSESENYKPHTGPIVERLRARGEIR